MSKKKTTESLSATDFKKVKSLAESGKLDGVISKLDPTDVPGTVKRVPKEVIRFMSHVLVNVKDVDTRIKTLKAEERIPIEILLESAKRYKGEEFARAFLEEAGRDENLRRKFDYALAKTVGPTEAKIDNAISEVYVVPHLMLKSKRLYTEVSFLQNDEVLLRSNAEVEDLLLILCSLMDAISDCVEYFEQNVKGVKPNINLEACLAHLDELGQRGRRARSALIRVSASPKKRKARGKSAKTGQSKTGRKRVKRKGVTRA